MSFSEAEESSLFPELLRENNMKDEASELGLKIWKERMKEGRKEKEDYSSERGQ